MLETMRLAKRTLIEAGHEVIDIELDFTDIFTAYVGICVNGLEVDMEGERVLPEYDLSVGIMMIP
jgi:hypothetical protein